MMPTVAVTRYVAPLREGGSLPGLVEGADEREYVCKFRGAGQGARVLVAEVIVAGLAVRVGLRTPRSVVLDLDPEIARYEADEEVQDLLNASPGANLGAEFLSGAFGFDGEVAVDPVEAARVMWLDAMTANVDRSWRNPNLLWWCGDLWLIDHGAALYFHHGWGRGVGEPQRFADQPWDGGDHVLGGARDTVADVDADLRARLTDDVLREVVGAVPDVWLEPVPGAEEPGAQRERYVAFLAARLRSRAWLPGGAT